MKHLLIIVLLLPLRLAAVDAFTFSLNTDVPDNDLVGLSDTRIIDLPYNEIFSVEVGLVLSGGWIGDLYASLRHESGFAVLLNRAGRTASDPDGSSLSALDVTFRHGAPDVHTADLFTFDIVSPDARAVDPQTVIDTDPRTAFLTSFDGLSPDGEWTLFIADVAAGDTTTLESWSLIITPVPEPGTSALIIGGLLLVLVLKRRERTRSDMCGSKSNKGLT